MQTTMERPADSLDALNANLCAQDANRRKALITLAGLRRQARDEIDRLIRFLDESDLDPDLEDDGSEEDGDVTEDDDVDEDNGDCEPSLGSLSSNALPGTQEVWAGGNRDDREDEHDGAEPDDEGDGWQDDEPDDLAPLDLLIQLRPTFERVT